MPYEVTIAVNFQRRDASWDSSEGWFETADGAIERAKQIVERAVRKSDFSAMTPRDLYGHFCEFGEVAYVRWDKDGAETDFDPWAYARTYCTETAGQPGYPLR